MHSAKLRPTLFTCMVAITAVSAFTTTTSVTLTGSEVRLVEELTGFQSPSGNVGCYIGSHGVRCDIAERDWAQPPRPVDCPAFLSSGQGLQIQDGVSSVVCAGDTALFDGADTLPYGTAIRFGTVQCDSNELAMTCRDTVTGHGFSLSRQSYQLF